jgi:type IV fimbrial biogenesis protein FimT
MPPSYCSYAHPTERGHTLLELLVTLSVVAILTGMAAPALAGMVRNIQGTLALNSFVATYQLARSEAISTRASVVLCSKDADNQCGKDWHKGAIAFTDRNNNRKLDIDQDERLLTEMEPPPAGSQMAMSAALGKQYLRFMGNGMLENTAGSFVICPPGGKARDARIAIFSRNGRLRFGTDTDHDGIQEDAKGQPLSCPLPE